MGAFTDDGAARLRGLAMRGRFEAHLTVASDRTAELEQACRELGIGCVLIALPAGAHPSQPMTASHHDGDLATAVAAVEALYAQLEARGFAIARVKLEADTTNGGVPETDAEAAALGGYFEFHVRVRVDAQQAERRAAERAAAPRGHAEVDRLRAVVAPHGAHVSRNAPDSEGERFVTLRVFAAGASRAEAQLAELERALADAGFPIAGVIRELTLYDSRVELDAGWLEPP